MKQYEAESRFSVSGDSLTGLLIHLGRHKRENSKETIQSIQRHLKKKSSCDYKGKKICNVLYKTKG